MIRIKYIFNFYKFNKYINSQYNYIQKKFCFSIYKIKIKFYSIPKKEVSFSIIILIAFSISFLFLYSGNKILLKQALA